LTALTMAGLAFITASGTVLSSAFIRSKPSVIESESIAAESALICSVRRFPRSVPGDRRFGMRCSFVFMMLRDASSTASSNGGTAIPLDRLDRVSYHVTKRHTGLWIVRRGNGEPMILANSINMPLVAAYGACHVGAIDLARDCDRGARVSRPPQGPAPHRLQASPRCQHHLNAGGRIRSHCPRCAGPRDQHRRVQSQRSCVALDGLDP